MAGQAGAETWSSGECGVRGELSVKSTGARFRFSPSSAIKSLGQIRFMLTGKHVNHEVYVAVLRRLPAGAAQPVSLVMDGHSVHRSGAVKPFVIYTQERRRMFFLSPCPSEGNPGEQVWNDVWNQRAGHAAPRSSAE